MNAFTIIRRASLICMLLLSMAASRSTAQSPAVPFAGGALPPAPAALPMGLPAGRATAAQMPAQQLPAPMGQNISSAMPAPVAAPLNAAVPNAPASLVVSMASAAASPAAARPSIAGVSRPLPPPIVPFDPRMARVPLPNTPAAERSPVIRPESGIENLLPTLRTVAAVEDPAFGPPRAEEGSARRGVANPAEVVGPPADPAPADWGLYTQPPAPAIGPMPLEYSLAAPPDGIIQSNEPRVYRAGIVDSATVFGRDLAFDQAIDLYRPDGLAPIGVTQDATMRQGQFLFSYRFNYQAFSDNFVGTHMMSDASVNAQYPFAPTQMNVNRNLLIAQYGLTDDFTIYGQLPFQHSGLDYTQTGGSDYRTAFTNPGDITLSTMTVLWRGNRQQIHLNLGLTFPVGFLDYQVDVPSPTLPNLPYAIRTSSGTYDLLPGLTYRGQNDLWTWGVQSIGTVRLGSNRLNYKLGDRADLTFWIARCFGERISASFRMDNQWWGNVRGFDPRLNQTLSPTNVPGLQGGSRIDLLGGLNLYLPGTRLSAHRFGIEGGAPIYQNLNGPQLGVSWVLNAGWNLLW